MKKVTTVLLGGMFISSMILSGVASVVDVKADTAIATTETNKISNTLVYKDLTGKQLKTATVTGDVSGRAIDYQTLSDNKPENYYLVTTSAYLGQDGASQTVTVVPKGRSPLYGVIRINEQTESPNGALLYPFGGDPEFGPHGPGLTQNTEWKIFETSANNNGDFYYRVDNDEWVSAQDATLISTTPITGENSIKKSDTSVVKTKNAITFLTRIDGSAVGNRALGPNTPWYTDKMAYINGEKYYRVATTEWVKAADITY